MSRESVSGRVEQKRVEHSGPCGFESLDGDEKAHSVRRNHDGS